MAVGEVKDEDSFIVRGCLAAVAVNAIGREGIVVVVVVVAMALLVAKAIVHCGLAAADMAATGAAARVRG